ncbi:DUF6090 family protein [Muriicola sp. Z0-33]|uniref:DUF6090 family protein n=1 Tax=Muriicola sp. Z0-33 TaxID=2816957 RepID=UPI00223855C8|nr:DUF6090 family protein [Muriicola sp. Z0-33]MCW5516022.1 hypothetical protein [Muriicola sp. Z0-33]
MISFFRRLRQRLLSENRFSKYLMYAIGEILLVVVGILLALQINNWNQERIQAKELDGLMKSISSAIQSDVKYLNYIRTARENMGQHADSIFNAYMDRPFTFMELTDYAYLSNTFNDLITTIYYLPNTSSFEALKSSLYLSKLQGTDIESLLHTYYSSADRIQKQEEEYNQILKADYRSWSNEFRNNGRDLFIRPWFYDDSEEKLKRFIEILNAESTTALFAKGFEEINMTDLYDLQITLGEKYIEMVDQKQVNFSEQTKISFSSIIGTYEEVDVLNLLIDGQVAPNFDFIYAQSGDVYYPGIDFKEDYLVITYPEDTFTWGSPYFRIKVLNGRVTELDFSKYKHVVLEMKGEKGGEEFALMMKDKYDLPDGKESRVNITLTQNWKKYQVPIDQFKTADMEIIETPLGFVFIGGQGKTIHVRSIQFN